MVPTSSESISLSIKYVQRLSTILPDSSHVHRFDIFKPDRLSLLDNNNVFMSDLLKLGQLLLRMLLVMLLIIVLRKLLLDARYLQFVFILYFQIFAISSCAGTQKLRFRNLIVINCLLVLLIILWIHSFLFLLGYSNAAAVVEEEVVLVESSDDEANRPTRNATPRRNRRNRVENNNDNVTIVREVASTRARNKRSLCHTCGTYYTPTFINTFLLIGILLAFSGTIMPVNSPCRFCTT